MSTDPREHDYSKASRNCDIVMKGGITSGVVYPHAVCELAKTYRLKNVGGASAGAIAAAAAGAAEAGRSTGGFKRLAGIPNWLTTGTNLFSLFQPQPATSNLFRVFVAGLGSPGGRPFRIAGAGLARFPVATLLGALPGLALIVLAILSGDGALRVAAVVAGVLLAVIGALLGLVAGIVRKLASAVPNNDFGLCSGLDDGGTRPALTPWLSDQLEELAGRQVGGPPLTFGDLKAAGVDLKLMTTNLTLRRPYRLPWDNREFFYSPDEFRRFFPENVVHWLDEHPPTPPTGAKRSREWELQCRLLRPLRPLPDPDDMPVIIATRMSLSFPVLLSAVPLWALDMSRRHNQEAQQACSDWLDEHPAEWRSILDSSAPDDPRLPPRPTAERCWFSDGGISSNFPVHFFDAPLPRWPTFAINLRPFHPDYPQSDDEGKNVYLPATSGGGMREWWYRFPERGGLNQLFAFGNSIVRTMQNRLDEAQMRAPGYRDRIAHVSLSAHEGGMNLTMPAEVIAALTERGQHAAEKLVDRFTRPLSPTQLSWHSHRWTRYRTGVAALSELVESFQSVYSAPPEPGELTYEQLLTRGDDDPPNAYRLNAAQKPLAVEFTDLLLDAGLVLESAKPASLVEPSPKPRPEARIVPRT